MAGPEPAATAHRPSATGYGPALALLTTLFFMWGFISVINGTLLPHLRSVFELSYFQTGLIESVWFIGYLLASIPAAKLIERIGYQRALTTGLLVMTTGSLGMILAAYLIFVPCDRCVPVRRLLRNRAAPGRGQSLCRGDRTAGDFRTAAHAGAGLQYHRRRPRVLFGKYLILGADHCGYGRAGDPAHLRATHGRRARDRAAVPDRRDRAGHSRLPDCARQAACIRRRNRTRGGGGAAYALALATTAT